MADDPCSFTKQELFLLKAPKKSPLVLRMIVLVFVMVCGVYICTICLKQISTRTNTGLFTVQTIEKPCPEPNVELSEAPYLHYPNPTSYSRAECACNPVRYFAILSMQRSGSGWFETLLNNHTNISSNGEIFSVKVRRSNMSTIGETLDRIYNLDWLSSASKNECTAAVGLKWMLNQEPKLALNITMLGMLGIIPAAFLCSPVSNVSFALLYACFIYGTEEEYLILQRFMQGVMQHHEEIVEYFKQRGVSAIFLFRRNLLRRMISVLANSYDRDAKPLNGTHKSHVHSPKEVSLSLSLSLLCTQTQQLPIVERQSVTDHMKLFQAEILAKYKPIINATLLIANLRQVEETTTKALEYFKSTRHILIYYEDVLKNRTKLIDVQDFLKVPRKDLKSRQVKIHKGPLSNQIENWGDIQKTLKGTPYESFLHADYRRR
ncbi:hypothetical protein FEM48_Zijuj09G0118700 [Ziziphus jujuba var. spinosa]|uniref:Sulfotransferase n=1 Tax=Ziziphus jujuba var. spinosa TaxID=714518 RepID=A0A978USV0_ZIZJJ|nr:hypothetical protein FEM48_Zijuj09G0118700 [Ziziphus jujuba var. spinosa]